MTFCVLAVYLRLVGTADRQHDLRHHFTDPSYCCDQETGLYHLWSRYYDPQTGRFISPDSYASTGQGILGYNMFAYCQNNPANYFDPSGNAAVVVCHADESIPFGGGLGFLGIGGGGGVGYAGAAVSSALEPVQRNADYINNSSESVAQRNLQNNGFAFYKGELVVAANILEGSAFTYGVIVVDDYYLNRPTDEFAETLKHEYGHAKHIKTIGLPAYTATTATPSFICAGIYALNIPGVSSFVQENYYSLPWERIADYLGGVNNTYAKGANFAGSVYWAYTVLVSFGVL